jgi:hypothetical protein
MGTEFDAANISQAELEIAMVIQAQVGYETKVQWAIARELALREVMSAELVQATKQNEDMNAAIEYLHRVLNYYSAKMAGTSIWMRRSTAIKLMLKIPTIAEMDLFEAVQEIDPPKTPWYLPKLQSEPDGQTDERVLFTVGIVLGTMFLTSLVISLWIRLS